MKINLEVIKKLNPCQNRLNNYIHYYNNKTFTLKQFFALRKINHSDKLWVVLRLIDNDTKVIFALDCAFSANAYAAYAAYVAASTYTATADAADYVAARAVNAATAAANATATEQKRQLEFLIYLIE